MSRFNAHSLSQGKLRALVLLLASFFAAGVPCLADEPPPLEYQVRAAFLLNFTKFVQWPAAAFTDPHSPLAICILGEDPFGNTLNEMVKGEGVNGHELVIQRIGHAPAPKSCQVLYIPRPEKDSRGILAAVGSGVLTVGEGEKFLQDGGIIAFVIQDRRVRFDIGAGAAERAMLTVSSRLMNVARSVEK
jgi:YfiR/HmsC-like